MKLLKHLKAVSNSKQILSWLYWIQGICQRNFDCFNCPLGGPARRLLLCRVRNIYRETHPEIDNPPYPDSWELSWPEYFGELVKKEPDDLGFLRTIKWDERGNPVPELKGDK